ncbi:hypothetical protein ACGFNV_03690 [Streptomyces sp. NPDC048751]|uniref:hypothetical protein n=1 Tax=Streptomyces sp. NPDC048751 TaxID=3365591 RepID=UPI00370FEBC3
MLTSLVKESAGVLDRRFLLVAFLPSLAFVWGSAVLGAVVALGARRARADWSRLGAYDKTLLIAVAFVAALLIATLLAGWSDQLVRWYAGYWPTSLGRVVGELGSTWHRGRQRRLAQEALTDRRTEAVLNDCYPPETQPEQVRPTRLGNVLKSAERYPRLRYGLDAVLVWPRLYPLLPDRVVAGLAAARADLECRLVMATLFALFAALSGTALLVTQQSWWLFAVCFGGGALAAWISYMTGVSAAVGYAEQVKVAFDVYRTDLLRHLDGTEPRTAAGERRRWQELSLLWWRGVRDGIEEPTPSRPMADRGARVMIMSLGACTAVTALAVCITGSAFLLVAGHP